jgi:hypothetical protein
VITANREPSHPVVLGNIYHPYYSTGRNDAMDSSFTEEEYLLKDTVHDPGVHHLNIWLKPVKVICHFILG